MLTGDLVRRDADGYYWFEGRKKQIIVRGGSNIAHQEVEQALYHHPAVLEAGVIGMPDTVYGGRGVAYVSLRDSATERSCESSLARDWRTTRFRSASCFSVSCPRALPARCSGER